MQKIGKRKRESGFYDRKQLLDKIKSGKSAAAVGHLYGINESTVRYIGKKEKEICETIASSAPASGKVTYHVRDKIIKENSIGI